MNESRPRERDTETLRVFVLPSSNTAEHESEVKERKEDEGIINAYGVLLTGVHRNVRRSTSFPSSDTPRSPFQHDSPRRDIRRYTANSCGSCRPGWLNARIRPEGKHGRGQRYYN